MFTKVSSPAAITSRHQTSYYHFAFLTNYHVELFSLLLTYVTWKKFSLPMIAHSDSLMIFSCHSNMLKESECWYLIKVINYVVMNKKRHKISLEEVIFIGFSLFLDTIFFYCFFEGLHYLVRPLFFHDFFIQRGKCQCLTSILEYWAMWTVVRQHWLGPWALWPRQPASTKTHRWALATISFLSASFKFELLMKLRSQSTHCCNSKTRFDFSMK